MIDKKTIEEIIKIATLSSEGLSDKSINIKEFYRDKVKPKIGAFKTKYDKTPNLLFRSELDSIKEPNKFNHDDIDSQGSPFFSARKLNPYVWATLHSKDYSATNSIQLFISVTKNEINFGLGYGNGIKNNSKKESEFVTIVKENEEIYAEIFEKIYNNQNINLYDHYSKIIEVNSRTELVKKWSSQSSVLGIFRTGDIPDDAGEIIHNVLNDLVNVFNKIVLKSNNNDMTDDESNLGNEENNFDNIDAPLNQILYGPPGTGKTYHTINKALEIIGKDEKENILTKKDIEDLKREKLKTIFDHYVKNGQIVFTTFHQSMSYEDFIEGIKPQEPAKEGAPISYKVEDGIFKRICTEAKYGNTNSFENAYKILIEEQINADKILKLKTPLGSAFGISVNSNDNLNLHTGEKFNKQGTLTKENILKQLNGEQKFKGWEGYFKGVIDHLGKKCGFSNTKSSKEKNYVLIIDEINRGNVSAIFGELITLIEDDKRMVDKTKPTEKKETLKIKLPYSKEPFSVPSNLYIIGTMNTADRSVEALDSALRRRFDFEEMPPKPEIIKSDGDLKKEKGILIIGENNFEIDLVNLLTTINDRIEILLDRDHLIGHSYLMKVKDEKTLKEAFSKQIIPLLKEYFYGDYGKISLVLGEEFCKSKKKEKLKQVFAVSDYETDDLEDKIIYKIIDLEDKELDKNHFPMAIKKLLRNSDK